MEIIKLNNQGDMEEHCSMAALVAFLHEHLKPWEDTPEDIRRGLDYALSDSPDRGGFVLLALEASEIQGALVMLHTPMGGYIPANILLLVAVDSRLRGQGIGRRLMEVGLRFCEGPVKLHVEYDNPARRLYERVGFSSKYAEMRHPGEGGGKK